CGAEPGIMIGGVGNFSCVRLYNNIAKVGNFRNRMLSVRGCTAGVRYTDGWVWATDFTDPEVVWNGADTWNFDRPGDAIAYFSGHGTCDDQTDTFCFST